MMSLRGGTTKQPRRVQYASDEVAALSLAMTLIKKSPHSYYVDFFVDPKIIYI